MHAQEFWFGVGLLAFAAFALSPYWWPPLIADVTHRVNQTRSRASRFRQSLPRRWYRMQSHWRGTDTQREKLAILVPLIVLGTAWLVRTCDTLNADDAPHPVMAILVFVIGLGVVSAAIWAIAIACEFVSWVWEGFWGEEPRPRPPAINPTNRAGIASPLGEAGFARAGNVDRALKGGRPPFTPPKFRN